MNLEAKVLVGDAREMLRKLPDASVKTVVTSPPYWGLRDYGHDGQIGLEQTPQDFIEQLCQVFDEVWRVLKDDGTIWVNLGDSYVGGKGSSGQGSPEYQQSRSDAGQSINKAHHQTGGNKKTRPLDDMATLRKENLKPKDLVGIPWRFAFAMQARGWYLRQDIIWAKPNPMPESVTDRCTKSHEYIFLLTKSSKYHYDHEAIKEPIADSSTKRLSQNVEDQGGSIRANGGAKTNGNTKAVGNLDLRNKRSVWSVNVKGYKEAHFATYPPELILPCILAGSKEGDTVLDPFSGSGTTGEVALRNDRNYIGLELSGKYAAISEKRLTDAIGMLGNVTIE